MPTYEYQCNACGHAFERFHSIKAAPIKRCPECGKAKVKRLLGTGAGLIFKGSGFYITDYRSETYKNEAKSDSGKPTGDTESAGKSDKSGARTASEEAQGAKKPDAKAESKPPVQKPSGKKKP